MLDEGYLEVEETERRDERYMGVWYRYNVKAIITKATTSIEQEVRKNDG